MLAEVSNMSVKYKRTPLKVYFDNTSEKGSIAIRKWLNRLSDEMITVLNEIEGTTGSLLAEIGTIDED